MKLSFAGFVLDSERRNLCHRETMVSLRPMAWNLLSLLLEQRPNVVTRDVLQESLWPGMFVEPRSLSQLVLELRKELRKFEPDCVFVETVPKVGYRWCFESTDVMETVVVERDRSKESSKASRQRVMVVSLIALLVVIGGYFLLSGRNINPRPDGARKKCVVLPFVNLTGDQDLDWIEFGLMDMVSSVFEGPLDVTPTSLLVKGWSDRRSRLTTETIPEDLLRELMKKYRAQLILHTRISRGPEHFVFSFTWYEDGRALDSDRVEVSNPADQAISISRKLLSILHIKSEDTVERHHFHQKRFLNETFAKGLQWFYFYEDEKAIDFFDVCLIQDPLWKNAQRFKAFALQRLGRQEEALKVAQKLMIQHELDDNEVSLGDIHFLLGDILLGLRRVDEAEPHLLKALEIREGDKERFQVLLALGQLEATRRDFEKAQAIYQRALGMAKDMNSVDGQLLVHWSIVQVLEQSHASWLEIEPHLNMSIEYARLLDNQKILAACITQLGSHHYHQNDMASAVTYYEQSLKLRRGLGDRRGTAINLDYLGDVYMQEGQLEHAEKALKEAESLWLSVNDPFNKLSNQLLLGNLYTTKNRYGQAENCYRLMIDLAKSSDDIEGQMLGNMGLWELAIHRGDAHGVTSIISILGDQVKSAPNYMKKTVAHYVAATKYFLDDAEGALALQLNIKKNVPPDSWSRKNEAYLETYQRAVANDSRDPLPLVSHPLIQPD